MTVTIKINCDNAAFDDPGELSRILRALALRLDDEPAAARKLQDYNGNTCGKVTVTP